MPAYKFILTSVISAETEDDAKEIFIADCAHTTAREFALRAEIEEVSE